MALQQTPEPLRRSALVSPKSKKTLSFSPSPSDDDYDNSFSSTPSKRTDRKSSSKYQRPSESPRSCSSRNDKLGSFLADEENDTRKNLPSSSRSRCSLDDSRASTSSGVRSKMKRKGSRRKVTEDDINANSGSAADLGMYMSQQQQNIRSPRPNVESQSAFCSQEEAERKRRNIQKQQLRHNEGKDAREDSMLDFVHPDMSRIETIREQQSSTRLTPRTPSKQHPPLPSGSRTLRSPGDSIHQRSSHSRRSVRSSETDNNKTSLSSSTPPGTPTTLSCRSTSSGSVSPTPASPPSQLPFLQVLYPSIQRRMSNPTIQEFAARQLHQGGTPIMAMVTANGPQIRKGSGSGSKQLRKKKRSDSSRNTSTSSNNKTRGSRDNGKRIPGQSVSVPNYTIVCWDEDERIAHEEADGSPDIFSFYSWSSSDKSSYDHQTPEATRLARESLRQSLRDSPLHKALKNMDID